MPNPFWTYGSVALLFMVSATSAFAEVLPQSTEAERAGSRSAIRTNSPTTSEGTGGIDSGSPETRVKINQDSDSDSRENGANAVESNKTAEAERDASSAENVPPNSAVSSDTPKEKDSSEAEVREPIWSGSPKIKVGGYVYSAFYFSDSNGSPSNEFHLRNARMQLGWSQGSLLDGEVEAELSKDGDDTDTNWAPLRDAYVRVSPLRALRIRMGQFKRPVGRLALMSHRELRLVMRGISNAWFNSGLDYAGRDIGAQIEGRIGKRYELEYAFAVMNGSGENDRESDARGAKDFAGRIVGHLGQFVEIGVNASNKQWDNPVAGSSNSSSAWMWGGDVAVDYKGLFGMVEGGYGDNYTANAGEKSFYVLALLAHKIPFASAFDLAVEPLIKGEFLKFRESEPDGYALAGTIGANLHVAKIFRLMVQGEWVQPANEALLPEKLGEASSNRRLIVQAALHTK